MHRAKQNWIEFYWRPWDSYSFWFRSSPHGFSCAWSCRAICSHRIVIFCKTLTPTNTLHSFTINMIHKLIEFYVRNIYEYSNKEWFFNQIERESNDWNLFRLFVCFKSHHLYWIVGITRKNRFLGFKPFRKIHIVMQCDECEFWLYFSNFPIILNWKRCLFIRSYFSSCKYLMCWQHCGEKNTLLDSIFFSHW